MEEIIAPLIVKSPLNALLLDLLKGGLSLDSPLTRLAPSILISRSYSLVRIEVTRRPSILILYSSSLVRIEVPRRKRNPLLSPPRPPKKYRVKEAPKPREPLPEINISNIVYIYSGIR